MTPEQARALFDKKIPTWREEARLFNETMRELMDGEEPYLDGPLTRQMEQMISPLVDRVIAVLIVDAGLDKFSAAVLVAPILARA